MVALCSLSCVGIPAIYVHYPKVPMPIPVVPDGMLPKTPAKFAHMRPRRPKMIAKRVVPRTVGERMSKFVEDAPPVKAVDEAVDVAVADAEVTGATVVEPATATPLGPMLTVLPPMTVVVAGAPEPMRYVVPLMTACVLPTEKVRPAAVTPERAGAGVLPLAGFTVVEGPATPLGPRLMVWPLTTTDVGFAPEPMA